MLKGRKTAPQCCLYIFFLQNSHYFHPPTQCPSSIYPSRKTTTRQLHQHPVQMISLQKISVSAKGASAKRPVDPSTAETINTFNYYRWMEFFSINFLKGVCIFIALFLIFLLGQANKITFLRSELILCWGLLQWHHQQSLMPI